MLVAKTYKFRASDDKAIFHEYDMGKKLWGMGIHVPMMYDIKGPKDGLDSWYLIMDKVAGELVYDVDKKDRVIELYRGECDRILSKGIVPHDSDWSKNLILNGDDLYFIDLEGFCRGDRHDIKMWHDYINKEDFKFRSGSLQ
jgi:tRNA A-37 threonylcarbamoyl transferase component Bud32